MGAVTFGIPKELVLKLQHIFSIDVFIETGTYKGKTTAWAAKHFKKVYTIENSHDLFESASKILAKFSNVTCILGNSANKLSEVLKTLNSPAVIWLDAHWCGGQTYGLNDECPLLEEITHINSTNENHIILIDDARYFLKPPPQTHISNQWPGLNEIIPALMKKNGFYTFSCEDIIAAVPDSAKELLQPYINSVHKNEFPGGGILSNINFAFRNIKAKWVN